MPSPRLAMWFDDYASYHTTRGNKMCHMIGIPLIVLSLLGILSEMRFCAGSHCLDASLAVIAATSIFYIKLDARLGVPFVLAILAMRSLALRLALSTHLWLFVLGWIAQGVGHYVYEKKSPAFLKNFQHLLIGPLWIFAQACGA